MDVHPREREIYSSHSHIHISHSELAMNDAMPLIQCAMNKLRSGLYSDCERGEEV